MSDVELEVSSCHSVDDAVFVSKASLSDVKGLFEDHGQGGYDSKDQTAAENKQVDHVDLGRDTLDCADS